MPEQTQGKAFLQTSNHRHSTCRSSGWTRTSSSWLVFEQDLWHFHLPRQEAQFADSSGPTSLKTALFTNRKGKTSSYTCWLHDGWSQLNLSSTLRVCLLTEFECRFPKYCLKGEACPELSNLEVSPSQFCISPEKMPMICLCLSSSYEHLTPQSHKTLRTGLRKIFWL